MTDRPTDRPTNQPRDRQTGSIIECKNDKYLGENKTKGGGSKRERVREGNGKRERTTEKKEEVWLGGGGKKREAKLRI